VMIWYCLKSFWICWMTWMMYRMFIMMPSF